jgi:hypothetical protein
MARKQSSPKKSSKIIPQQVATTKTEDERRHMIAEAAYYHAEHRGFLGGSIEEDWYIAEAEIDAMLSGKKLH